MAASGTDSFRIYADGSITTGNIFVLAEKAGTTAENRLTVDANGNLTLLPDGSTGGGLNLFGPIAQTDAGANSPLVLRGGQNTTATTSKVLTVGAGALELFNMRGDGAFDFLGASTASLVTCDSSATGLVQYDTTVGTLKLCDGTKYLPLPSMSPRWVKPFNYTTTGANQTATVGRVYVNLTDITGPCNADAIGYSVGTTSAGNVIVGIYGPVNSATELCETAPLIVQSSSVAQGSVNNPQVVTFTRTTLPIGLVCLGIEFSDAGGSYLRRPNIRETATSWVQSFDLGAFLALPGTAPTVDTVTASGFPNVAVRCVP